MAFYSQYGEDELLWEYFGKRPAGLCVEVGGFDGVSGSNSLFFEEQGWTAILVEPIPELAERIRQRRPRAQVFNVAAGASAGETVLIVPQGAEVFATMSDDLAQMDRVHRGQTEVRRITVPVRTLDEILKEANVKDIDFVTIDVEGAEEMVLAGFDLSRWNPRVLILENNFGKYSPRFRRKMGASDYHFWRRTGCNEWYLRGDDKLVTPGMRFRNGVQELLYTAVEFVQSPFKRLWRESGLKAWNHRRLRARRERRRRGAT